MLAFDIKDKVALISGGASGIGFQYALALLEKGARGITLADINPELGVKALKEIEERFGKSRAVFIKTDVSNYNEFEDAFKITLNTFRNIDILINNAGLFRDDQWQKEIAVNVNGTIHGILLGLDNYIPNYKSGPEGVIVNISSTAGIGPYSSVPIYTGTKFAIHGMTLSWGLPAHYDRTKVKVIGICPGATLTSMVLNMEGNTLGPVYEAMKVNTLNRQPQKPEVVAPRVMEIIEKAESGTMWVVERNEPPYKFQLPDRHKIPKVFLE